MKFKLILCGVLLLAIAVPVLAQGETPSWAGVGNYARYRSHGEGTAENLEIDENVRYSFYGDILFNIENVAENYATAKFNYDETWENDEIYPYFWPSENGLDNIYYDSLSFFVPRQDLDDLTAGVTPGLYENTYKGIVNVAVPYGELKCFHFFDEAEFENRDMYYSYDAGVLVKYSYRWESPPSPDSWEETWELQDTNILRVVCPPSPGLPWLWIVVGVGVVIIVCVILAGALRHRGGKPAEIPSPTSSEF